tara:strand:- start:252 stop:644 length:393 start_codon:yes stop_codon:yes gene_type:complete
MVWQDAYPTDFEFQGHRFYAYIDTQSDEGNVENFSDEERIIRHTFNMTVNAYLIPRSNVQFSRSFTKISLQENVVDSEDLDAIVNREKNRLDSSLAKERKINPYDKKTPYNRGSESLSDDDSLNVISSTY